MLCLFSQERLGSLGLFCQVLDKEAWFIKMLEKHIWICAFMAVGAKHKVTVGAAEAQHADEVKNLIAELEFAASQATGVRFPSGLQDRLCTYARAVAHFPTALKEFEVQNTDAFIRNYLFIHIILSNNVVRWL